MAAYYDFPSEVVVSRATRLYLKEVRFSYPEPTRLNDPARVIIFRVTDDQTNEVRTLNLPISEAQWNSFVSNFAALPGANFEEKILLQGPNLISAVPAGGSIIVEE